MYHPTTPWGPQLVRWDGFSWIITFVPGGANGVLFKSKNPLRKAWADNLGFDLALRRRFSVSKPCSSNLSHSDMGKLGSVVARSAIK